MATDITKGIEPFEATTDFSRNNADRKPWGKSNSAENLHMGTEYDVDIKPRPIEYGEGEKELAQKVAAKLEAEKVPKFSHKLANGTVLEAPTIEELATLIEKSVTQTPPAPVEYEDKPPYVPMEFKRKELTLAEQAEILNLWKENPQMALGKLEEAEYGAPMSTILQNLSRAEQREAQRVRLDEEAAFLMEAETYHATPANAKKIMAVLDEKKKPITKKNLLLAFQQLVAAGDQSLLVKLEEAAPLSPDPNLTEPPPPPTIVPSNQGRPETPNAAQLDVEKFSNMTLAQQKDYFAGLRRGK